MTDIGMYIDFKADGVDILPKDFIIIKDNSADSPSNLIQNTINLSQTIIQKAPKGRFQMYVFYNPTEDA